MKKLGAWLIKTSHNIARWWGGLIFAISFKMKDCKNEKCICTK
jgi:hypothetical protein